MLNDTEIGAVQAIRVASATTVELHVRVRPDAGGGAPGGAAAPGDADFEALARSMYAGLRAVLREHDLQPNDVVAEKIFLDDVGGQAPRLAVIRREVYGDPARGALHPATTYVGEPPVPSEQVCELQALAVATIGGASLPSRNLYGLSGQASGRVVEAGGLRHVYLSGFSADPDGGRRDFGAQASALFADAEAALRSEGATFAEVVRTWICLADIERDYTAFNRARRDFFGSRGIVSPPASTAIRGVPFPADRACGLDLRAVAGTGKRRVTPFRISSMNEASTYGSDFSRGMRVELEDRAIIYVSGTSSIDAKGRVVHPGDIEGQADWMLKNIEALLASQDAGYANVVSAITYLKEPAYAAPFRRVAARRGLPARVPNTLCVADICRPEWLCEMEVTAVRV
jgi:enamine deaminase RidA (YjgF/YER057c/UK114 family)